MSDLIDRQAAIDVLIEWYGCEPNDIESFEEIIEALPSAQPEITKEAVELYCRQRCLTVITNDLFNEMKARWSQPEIIRCKDCKHHWTHKCMDSMPIERCDLEQTFYDAEVDYCSLAERRTDE